MIRDRDRIYGTIVTRRLRAMGIRDKPTVPASPWQNGFAERLIGSIRRECLDHVIVLGEAHLRRNLGHWTKMRRFLVRFIRPESFVHPRSAALAEWRMLAARTPAPLAMYASFADQFALN